MPYTAEKGLSLYFQFNCKKEVTFCKVDSDSNVLIEEDSFVEDFKRSISLPRPKQVSVVFILPKYWIEYKRFKTVSGEIVLSPTHSLFSEKHNM